MFETLSTVKWAKLKDTQGRSGAWIPTELKALTTNASATRREQALAKLTDALTFDGDMIDRVSVETLPFLVEALERIDQGLRPRQVGRAADVGGQPVQVIGHQRAGQLAPAGGEQFTRGRHEQQRGAQRQRQEHQHQPGLQRSRAPPAPPTPPAGRCRHAPAGASASA